MGKASLWLAFSSRPSGTRDAFLKHGSRPIGAEEPLAVEVDEVGRGVCDPDFRFPCDIAEVAAHGGNGWETRSRKPGRGWPRRKAARVLHDVFRPRGRDWLRYGFDQQEPVSLRVVQNNIGHLAVRVNVHAELGEKRRVEVTPLLAGVAGIDQRPCGDEARPEILDNRADQLAVLAWAEGNFLTGRYLDRNKLLLALMGVLRGKGLPFRKVGR